MTLRGWFMLSQIFRGVNPHESTSRLRHAAAGTAGPHSPREIAGARNKARKAGYTPESLLVAIGELPVQR